MQFQKAERRRAFIKLAITGPSGSGKTYSALRIARGLGERVALLDTENGSGSLYADLYPYDTLELAAPFLVKSYAEAISAAEAGGYDVLIIDSLTHAWAGEGGLLAQKEALDSRGGNSFTNWATITKQHEALKAAILQARVHVIATMRSKTEYVVDQGDGKKAAPRKVGLAPVQRDGIEFEFTTVFDVAPDHTAVASKDRTGLFDGLNTKLSEEQGRMIADWLRSASSAPAPAPVQERVAAAAEQYGSYSESMMSSPPIGAGARPPNGAEELAASKAEFAAAAKAAEWPNDAAEVRRRIDKILGRSGEAAGRPPTAAEWRKVAEGVPQFQEEREVAAAGAE